MTPADASPRHERETLRGLACHRLSLPCGDSVLVCEHGGQVLSWVAAGRERLYLSARAVFDGRAAIRGGIPMCWPQFSDQGTLPRHGWVRQAPWRFARAACDCDAPSLTLEIDPADACPAEAGAWPFDSLLQLGVVLTPGSLAVTLAVFNRGTASLPFTGALHTYLALKDAGVATVAGWPASPGRWGWDSVRRTPRQAEPAVSLRGEIDCILPAAPGPLELADGDLHLRIEQSGWADTVVWNPGADKCSAMSDMGAGDERRMACIEAAQALSPAVVPAGGLWQGTQRLTVARRS
jgi:glucose-6-phosphate 1-epimerase